MPLYAGTPQYNTVNLPLDNTTTNYTAAASGVVAVDFSLLCISPDANLGMQPGQSCQSVQIINHAQLVTVAPLKSTNGASINVLAPFVGNERRYVLTAGQSSGHPSSFTNFVVSFGFTCVTN